ncbi:serine/threonine protein kinase [Candidatus Uabimicrobium amorphum]|uniref:Serine/threonine protein kinase n=1 Tax=Uabimicrobium amorphum TaxID=2596890 RepID=A0A5S9IL60_UABAM|nr:serine/threonine-protein kinase [Candidatus Uabimicrobium amorphum]BBM83899.1 serine/threonine protein kinase [Candidatus Uabimicrobium amorphum]
MIGKNFKGFEIVKLLGKGGTGDVYLAKQQPLGRLVALKVTPTSHPTLKLDPQKPLGEAKILAALQHPNIVSIYDVGQEEDFHYIAIEYISKGSLKQKVDHDGLSEMQAWAIALQICQALQAALQEGIVHNDIKPENILMVRGDFIKLTDFGISEVLANKRESEVILGTPGYISPEKYTGESADFRADIYSLGVTMYYILTGEHVFVGESPEDIQQKHQNSLIKPPTMHNPSVSYTSSIILGKMLQKNPEDRYQSYGDLMLDIRCLLEMKSAKFATKNAAYNIFLDARNHVSNKKMKISQKLKVFTESMLHQLDLDDDTDIVIVGEWPVEHIRKTFYHFSRVHFMGSIAELKLYLERRKAIVILDCDYLENKTVEFCSVMANNHPQSFSLLLTKNISGKLQDCIQVVPYEDLSEKLNQLVTTQTLSTAVQVDVDMVLSLAQSKYWTFAIEIYNDSLLAKVFIENGHIAKIDSEQTIAMDALTKKGNTWKISGHLI